MRTTLSVAGLVMGVLCVPGAQVCAQDGAEPALQFDYQTGEIELRNKIATLHLGQSYRYLNPAEAEKLLVAWGNQPGNDTQGAIVPREVDPMSETGWAVILTYEDDGHVDDSDAAE